MSFENLLEKALLKIAPKKKEIEEIENSSNEIKERLSKTLPEKFSVCITGSVAKGTFLSGSADIDVFILVPKEIPQTEFLGIVQRAIEKSFPKEKNEIKYAQHPYIRLYLKSKKIDVVPAYKIDSAVEMESAVDRSVLHTGYIRSKLKEGQKNEVMLLKQFLKTYDLYGAEIRVCGFSGYLCELLILKYGNFLNTIREGANWKFPFAIDIEGYYKTEKEIIEKFKTENMTVIDPVDKNRDVSSVVSDEVIYRFIFLCRSFMKNPSVNFFSGEKFKIALKGNYLKRHANLISLSFQKPNVVDDILWGQIRKFSKKTAEHLDFLGFHMLDYYSCESNGKIFILFEMLEEKLSDKKMIFGPFVCDQISVERFKAAHKNSVLFIKNGRMLAIEKREITNAAEGIKKFLKNKNEIPSHLKKTGNMKIEKKVSNKVLTEYFLWRKIFRD
ncbi:MAG: CCA tRNA nucleotidyltransferase [Candidatus Micrarchaeia archaeon]